MEDWSTVGFGQVPRVRNVPAGEVAQVLEELVRAKRRFGLPPEAPVVSCYEAGRIGFWLHRCLQAHGLTNYVVDSSSIEVPRRARRMKTDRLDLVALVTLLGRYLAGDRRAWRVVRIPSVAEEDARHLSRALEALTADRTRLINRIRGLLSNYGVRMPVDRTFPDAVRTARMWDERPLPPGVVARLTREWAHLRYLTDEMRTARARQVPDPATPAGRHIGQLEALRGGPRQRVGADDGALRVAPDSQSARARGARRAGAGSLPKWRDRPRSRHHARGQRACAAGDRPAGVGLAPLSTGQRARAMARATLCQQ